VDPHESMTCGVHGIYLKFGSFNGIDPIVPFFNYQESGSQIIVTQQSFSVQRGDPIYHDVDY
jgi:hypothetical protein